jgi:hypothetical protein
MKNPAQLEAEYQKALVDLNCKCHAEYFTKFTGNMVTDFASFTLLQSGDPKNGYKSCDPKDKASANPPPTPYTDGKYYHTVKDVTWSTYHSIFPKRPASMFYNMTDEERGICVMKYINAGKLTTSPLVNILLSYIAWGGSLSKVLHTYCDWYSGL